MMRSLARSLALVPLLCGALVGCLTSPVREAALCLDRRESALYFADLRQSVAREWKKPRRATGTIVVTARVSREGALRRPAIRVQGFGDEPCSASPRCRAVERPLLESMDKALRAAQPVGPPPEGARCMLKRTLEMTFDTSEIFIPDPEDEAP